MIRTIIVDDEPLALDVMRSLLRAHDDVDVLGAYRSGSKALDAIHEFGPDLVFLDIQMPGMSGFELISKLQHMVPGVSRQKAEDFLVANGGDLCRAAHALRKGCGAPPAPPPPARPLS